MLLEIESLTVARRNIITSPRQRFWVDMDEGMDPVLYGEWLK